MEEHKAIGVLDVPYLRPTMLGFMSDDEVVDDDIYTNKIGGYPLWLGDPISEQELKCSICDRKLVLILQIAAPLPQLPDERSIFLFSCINRQCGAAETGGAKSWKAFRVHKQCLPAEREEGSIASTADSKVMGSSDSSWGADADDWGTGGDWATAKEVDFEKLLEQKEAATQGKGKSEKVEKTTQTKAKLQREGERPFYVPYYMDIEEEDEGKELPVSQRVKELAEKYKEEAAGGGADWNEEFEQTGDKIFMRFQETLRRNPNQILRYCFGGFPLWMSSATPEEVPRCERCGQERVFELQVLSTLIYLLDDKRRRSIQKQKKRAKNRGGRGKKGGGSETVPPTTDAEDGVLKPPVVDGEEEGLEFGTLVLYSCRNNCGEPGAAYPEYVFIQPAL